VSDRTAAFPCKPIRTAIVERLLGVLLIVSTLLPQLGAATDELAYTVRSGDTLIGISRQYLIDPQRWSELKRLNRIRNDRRLMPGSTLRIPLDWLRQTRAQVTVLEVAGEVKVDGRTPRAGDKLTEGARIETGKQGAVALELTDGSSVNVQPETSVRLERLRI